MLAITLSLVAACCWGISDFAAGLLSRRLSVISVVAAAQLFGLGVAALLVLVSGDPFPDRGAAIAAVAAGCSGLAGLALFYRALAVGTMSVVAPIGATGVALPLLVGLAGGDNPGATQAVGLATAVAGVLVASRESREGEATGRMRGAGLAVLAALGFGGYFVAAHTGARGGVPWLLVLSHGVIVPVVIGAALMRAIELPAREDLPALIGVGAFDIAATALYGLANRHGLLSIVSVVGSLYPVTTLLLARRLLRERLVPSQAVGVSLALGGVALIAAG